MNEIVSRAQSGKASDREAFVAEFTKAVKQLARYYSRTTGGAADVDDLESEGWIYVLKQLPKVDTTKGNSMAHLYSHARYGMLDYLKASFKYGERETLMEDTTETAIRDVGSLRCRERDFAPYLEWKIAAHNTIADLRPKNRVVLELMLEGLNGCEIADALGCTKQGIDYYRTIIRRQVSEKLFGGKYA